MHDTADHVLIPAGDCISDALKLCCGEGDAERDERLSTGFNDLDRLTGGFERGEFITLASRAGEGKSSLALNIAFHASESTDCPVAYFSLEHSSRGIAERLLSLESGIPLAKIQEATLTDEEKRNLRSFQNELTSPHSNIYVCDKAFSSVADIREILLNGENRPMPRLIVVDGVKSLRPSYEGRINSGIYEDIVFLKQLARSMHASILVTAPLSRHPKNMAQAPSLFDLRETAAYEDASDIILLLDRNSVLYKDQDLPREETGRAQLIVAKSRRGERGYANLSFDEGCLSFTSSAFPVEGVEHVCDDVPCGTAANGGTDVSAQPAEAHQSEQLLNPEAIRDLAEKVFELDPGSLAGRRRGRYVQACRTVAVCVCKKHGYSYEEIGAAFKRDHSSIMYLAKSAEEKLEKGGPGALELRLGLISLDWAIEKEMED